MFEAINNLVFDPLPADFLPATRCTKCTVVFGPDGELDRDRTEVWEAHEARLRAQELGAPAIHHMTSHNENGTQITTRADKNRACRTLCSVFSSVPEIGGGSLCPHLETVVTGVRTRSVGGEGAREVMDESTGSRLGVGRREAGSSGVGLDQQHDVIPAHVR